MQMHELQAAMDGLSTGRLQRLADRLEADPSVRLTVGDWRHCPMTVAGFDLDSASPDAPERAFAYAWDAFAAERAVVRWHGLFTIAPRRIACRADVQRLLRMTNAALARRAPSRPGLAPDRPSGLRHLPRRS